MAKSKLLRTEYERERQEAKWSGRADVVFQIFILGAIYILAFSTRLFSVVRFEMMIHEFDPQYNHHVSQLIVAKEDGGRGEPGTSILSSYDAFDPTAWYPLGRALGQTTYFGLMWTAASLFHLLRALHFSVNLRDVCVLLAPFMASNTSIVTYLLTKEIWNRAAGVVAALFIALAPAYISRSVAGSYDNEAVAIFCLVLTFWLWIKAVKTGSMLWGGLCALGYYWMVASWGGYIFIVNLIPVHVLVLVVSGRYSHRVYVAYCTWLCVGTVLSMTVPFVSFIPVSAPEHLPAIGVFGILQLYSFFFYVRSLVRSEEHMRTLLVGFAALLAAGFALIVLLSVLGYVPFLTGRLLSLLGSTSNIAIVKSVSEHQPSAWTTFFFDLHALTFLMPAGIYFCYSRLSDSTIFLSLYVLFAMYFSGIMVRLVLVLAPAACSMGAIAASETLRRFSRSLLYTKVSPLEREQQADEAAEDESSSSSDSEPSDSANDSGDLPKVAAIKSKSSSRGTSNSIMEAAVEDSAVASINPMVALLVVLFFASVLGFFVIHCTWVTSYAYSSPSVVLQARNPDGSRTIFDDYREAYEWLSQNTAPDAKVMSWWDYGYQIREFADRITLVDNNTRNNTHIATVGLAMASTEEDALPILRHLDVDYVLVVFGGKIGYSSDDINKFLWMVRISSGVYPRIVESDYFSKYGQYRIDSDASDIMKNSLMYKMCYYGFDQVVTQWGQEMGYDRVRGAVMGKKNIELKYLEEAFTSEHWMVRIYRVRKDNDRLGGVDFDRGTVRPKKVKKLYKRQPRKVQYAS